MARGKKDAVPGPTQTLHADPFRLERTSLWEAVLGMLAAGVCHVFLPDQLVIGPSWLLLAIEGVLLLPLVFLLFTGHMLLHKTLYPLLLTLLGVLTLSLASNIALLIITMVRNKNATILLRAAILLWGSNVLVFGLWYWHIDGGGPMKRQSGESQTADFLFPQQETNHPPGWIPCFLDYLFLAFTGATALSPTEMFPLTSRAKALMMGEALLSLLVVAVPAVSQFHLPW